MKKLVAATGAVLMIYVILTAMMQPQTAAQPAFYAVSATEEDSVVYVMCEENDRIVVKCDGQVFLRTDTPVSSLPKRDRQKLAEGITLFSKEELKTLLEDYCS